MLSSRFATLSFTLAAAVPVLPAQRTWTVGPGGQFSDIQPAIDAASPGDIIRVRPGLYGGFNTSKGVALLGDPGARISSLALPSVNALPAGSQFVVAGFIFESRGGLVLPSVSRCAGRVLFDHSRVMLDALLLASGYVSSNVLPGPGFAGG